MKRDIGQEILDALREVKAGGGKRTTMDDRYSDKSGHLSCNVCGMCIYCGDCKRYGCRKDESRDL